MKKLILSGLIAFASIPSISIAGDMSIPWATNSGVTENTHISALGEDMNASHQEVTMTQEGVWAKNSGSIRGDEESLLSNKERVAADPALMPHQG
ncbi:MAG TPA: hypothetical protein VGI71_18300 [Scandinavium sp.]